MHGSVFQSMCDESRLVQFIVFFFSSRRRHTRFDCDWSSDVCSSDLIADVTAAGEGEGARIYKWPADPKHVQQNNGNDFAWFRLAEMYLIKAEAELAGGTGSSTPLALLRLARARAVPRGDTLYAPTPPQLIPPE